MASKVMDWADEKARELLDCRASCGASPGYHADQCPHEHRPAVAAALRSAAPRWVPVSERLPDLGDHVLVYRVASMEEMVRGEWEDPGSDWVWWGANGNAYLPESSGVTAWRVLPSTPEGGDGE